MYIRVFHRIWGPKTNRAIEAFMLRISCTKGSGLGKGEKDNSHGVGKVVCLISMFAGQCTDNKTLRGL